MRRRFQNEINDDHSLRGLHQQTTMDEFYKRESGQESGHVVGQRSDQVIVRGSGQDIGQEIGRGSVQGSGQEIGRGSVQESGQEIGQGSGKEIGQVDNTTSVLYTLHNTNLNYNFTNL